MAEAPSAAVEEPAAATADAPAAAEQAPTTPTPKNRWTAEAWEERMYNARRRRRSTVPLMRARGAAKRLQSAIRRAKWKRLIGAQIPMVHGWFGIIAWPIYGPPGPPSGPLLGLEGPNTSRFYMRGGLLSLRADHPLRIACVSAVELAVFERAVLAAVVANCLFLAVQGPPEQYGWLAEPQVR